MLLPTETGVIATGVVLRLFRAAADGGGGEAVLLFLCMIGTSKEGEKEELCLGIIFFWLASLFLSKSTDWITATNDKEALM